MKIGRRLAGMLLAGMLLVMMGVGGGSAHADQRPTAPAVPGPKTNLVDGYYEIRNLRTQGCVDVKGRSHTAGGIIRQYNCEGNQANQLWRLEPAPDFSYYALRNRESFQCLDIRSTNPVPPNRTVVEQQPCNVFKQNQRWVFRYFVGADAYNLVSYAGGKCLDLDDGSVGNDKRIQMWDCEGSGNDHQLWQLK